MKRTPTEKEEENRFVFDYTHAPADLSIENTKIVWKSGIYVAILLLALFMASYYVDQHIICWLTFLMPIGTLLIARKNRIRKTHADIQFHTAWLNMWGMAAALAIIPSIDENLPEFSIFSLYYTALILGLIMTFEMLHMGYASLPLIAAGGISVTGLRESMDPESSIRANLIIFFVFDVLAIIIGGVVMQWQLKNQIKNPINFPQSKPKQ